MFLRRPFLSNHPLGPDVIGSSTAPLRRVMPLLAGDLTRRPSPPHSRPHVPVAGSSTAYAALQNVSHNTILPLPSLARRVTNFPGHHDFGDIPADFLQSVTLSDVAAMDPEQRRQFLSWLSAKLLRNVPPVPPSVTEGDSFCPIPLPNWQELFAGYKLAFQLLRSLPQEDVVRWVDRNFIFRLVGIFHSADRNEQGAAELLLSTVFATLEFARGAIADDVLNLLVCFIDGIVPFLCVPPALRFFIKYFNSLSGPWTATHAKMFPDVFFRLFTCNHTHDFYDPLCQLCQVFYQRNCEFADWGIRYLAAHWPRTNSQKGVVYFHHASVAAPLSKVSENERLVNVLFGFIVRGVQSANFKVALAALALCADLQFLGIFTVWLPVLLPQIIDAVGIATQHWNATVKEKSTAALQALLQLGQRIKSVSRPEKPPVNEEERRDTWSLITQMAADSGG
jgi:hypothetical protein